MVFVDLRHAVNRSFIQSLGFLGRVLDLQSSFDVFHRCSNEGDCGAGHDTCHSVADCRQLVDSGVREGKVPLSEGGGGGSHAVRVEEGFVQDSSVEGEGPEHDAVHEHPSYKRWGSPLV